MAGIVCLLVALLLAAGGVSGTLAYVVTQTQSIINTFVNGEPTGSLEVTKTVVHPFGDAYTVPENDYTTFSFSVNLGSGNANKTFGNYTADASGVVTLRLRDGGSATLKDIPEKTTVTVTETTPGTGFSPDATTKTATIVHNQTQKLAFTNTYKPLPPKRDVSAVTLKGSKDLEGRAWQAGDTFTFELQVSEGGEWVKLGETTITAEFDDEGKLVDASREFDLTDAFWDWVTTVETADTYSLRVVETAGSIGGVTYDATSAEFNVVVGDAQMDGYLEVQGVSKVSDVVTVSGNQTDGFAVAVAFRNSYAPAGSTIATVNVTKTLDDQSGRGLAPEGFVFELVDADGEVALTSDPTNAEGETSLRLVLEPSQAGHAYVYTLRERDDGAAGVTYDTTEVTLLVSVVDNLDGTVSAYVWEAPEDWDGDTSQVVKPDDATSTYEAEFANTYAPSSARVVIRGTKTLDGRALAAGEFSFALVDEGGNVVSRATNDASGNFAFDALTFDKVGTRRYVAYEEAGSLPGVTYDETRYQVTVTVTDGGKGALVADVSVAQDGQAADGIAFANSYETVGVGVTLTGTKTLTGRALAEGEFTFAVYDEAGEQVATATNAADGSIVFPELTFAEAGTYTYRVVEVDGGAAGVTYDDASYDVTVTVTDDGAGSLTATVDGGEIAFANGYTAGGGETPVTPSQPGGGAGGGEPLPDNGDATVAFVPVALAVAGLVCLAFRKRLA